MCMSAGEGLRERERVSERGGLGKSAAAMPRLTSDCIA